MGQKQKILVTGFAVATLLMTTAPALASNYETGVRLTSEPTVAQAHFRADQMRIRHADGHLHKSKRRSGSIFVVKTLLTLGTNMRASISNVPADPSWSEDQQEGSVVSLNGRRGSNSVVDYRTCETAKCKRANVGVKLIGGAAAGVGHVLGQLLARAIF